MTMEKLFICLANSKKYTERCIAGIELVKSSRRGYKYDIVKAENNKPIWIRPASGSQHGEVSSNLVGHVNLLDIVKINVTRPNPQGYQSENVLFDPPLSILDSIQRDSLLIDRLLSVDEPVLFGNKGKAVSIADIGQLNYSLVLIKPANVQVYSTTSRSENRQIRASFVFNDIPYDLPVTDIDFTNQFSQNPMLLESCTHIYFTISLGIEFQGLHYKLIAGVVYL